jgi:hypothetical protein
MAEEKKTDLVARIADLSEGAIQRLSDMPYGDRVASGLNTVRERVDDLQKRVRGLEDLERRLSALERKVDKLGKTQAPSSPKPAAPKTPAAAGPESTG